MTQNGIVFNAWPSTADRLQQWAAQWAALGQGSGAAQFDGDVIDVEALPISEARPYAQATLDWADRQERERAEAWAPATAASDDAPPRAIAAPAFLGRHVDVYS